MEFHALAKFKSRGVLERYKDGVRCLDGVQVKLELAVEVAHEESATQDLRVAVVDRAAFRAQVLPVDALRASRQTDNLQIKSPQ